MPLNLLHELYRNAFETSQAQKEEQEKREAEEKAKAEEEARISRKNAAVQRGRPKSSPIPMKQNQSESPQISDAQARAADLKVSGMEEIFDELS